MAEVAVDERRLLKTMRWWDGFVIGLANPGFLLIGLWRSRSSRSAVRWPAILWVVSACIGALQAYIYCEPAAMFPDKPGGLSVYAREGWRKYFSFAGPIAVFGYWFAWSSVLAIYGGLDRPTAARRVRRRKLPRDVRIYPARSPSPSVGAADRRHVHRPLLHLQHPGDASRGRGSATSSGP